MLRILIAICALLAGCGNAQETLASKTPLSYDAHFELSITADAPDARAKLTISQPRNIIRQLDFDAPPGRYRFTSYDGILEIKGNRVSWRPPNSGGALAWTYHIDEPADTGYRAHHSGTWAMLRLGDVFPAAKVRTLKGAHSVSTLSVDGTDTWSYESRYGALTSNAKSLGEAKRNFNRPTGWLLAGQLGTRRERIGEHLVAVSAPIKSGMRRLDVLAFLNWTLPDLTKALPSLPERVFISGAPQEMWRGGVSAPGSVYLHVARPLVSENGTSTLLHELVHAAGVHSAAPGHDWLVEGLAEYYSLVILRRSGGLSNKRFQNSLTRLEQWAEAKNGRLSDPSQGADTAAAVVLLHHLAQELAAHNANLDTIVQQLIIAKDFSTKALVAATNKVLGGPSLTLRAAQLDTSNRVVE